MAPTAFDISLMGNVQMLRVGLVSANVLLFLGVCIISHMSEQSKICIQNPKNQVRKWSMTIFFFIRMRLVKNNNYEEQLQMGREQPQF